MKLSVPFHIIKLMKSPPVRGRGLKHVAPRAGAWIETGLGYSKTSCCFGRPPCGGVD